MIGGISFGGSLAKGVRMELAQSVAGEVAGWVFISVLVWALIPVYHQLKPKAISACCWSVPGRTPTDVRFYWNHWAIRLTLAWSLLNVGIITWEHMTGTRAHPLFEVTSVTIFLVVLTYIVREMWQARRRKHQTPGNSTGSGVNST